MFHFCSLSLLLLLSFVNSPDVPRRERALGARTRVPERLGPHQRVTAAAAAPTPRCLSLLSVLFCCDIKSFGPREEVIILTRGINEICTWR